MDSTLGAVMLTSLAACIATAAGLFVVNRFAAWIARNWVYFLAFAAGVLITIALTHLIPDAIEMNAQAPLFLLAGFLAIVLYEELLESTGEDGQTEAAERRRAAAIGWAVAFHSLVEGITLAVTLTVGLTAGVLAAVALTLHKFPEGVATLMLLERSGYRGNRALVYALGAVAVPLPLGAILSYRLVVQVSRQALGVPLAIVAGVLLYVGASHLLPMIEQQRTRFSTFALVVGVLVTLLAGLAG